MQLKRVVVTGLGAVTPLGNDVSTTWANMIAGKSGIAPITHFDTAMYKTKFAGEVKDFDASSILDRKELRKLDRYEQFCLWVANQAVTDSGLQLDEENKERIGVIWGSGMGGLQTFEDEVGSFALSDGIPRFNPFFLPKILISMGAGQISLRYGLKGASYGVTSACSSASHAIANAYDMIRLGRAEVMLTGGAEAAVTAAGIGSFSSIHALSTRNDNPSAASRPFSKSRDGFVMGEGAACLVLEEYEHAIARGAKIYAELAGAGMTSDAYHITAPDPEGKGAAQVMREAIAGAEVTVENIDYINTHGTSTPLGDLAEVHAIESVFGEYAKRLSISSTKSMTGHALGAAGAIEAMATIMAIHTGIVPPTINHEEGDEDENIPAELDFTFNTAKEREIRCALSNTFGFGGHNACLLFKKI